jgi:hypothetical protein
MCRRLPLVLLLAAAALAGCGGSGSGSRSSGEASKSASAILADARQAALAAESVHLVGAVHNAKERISLDLSLTQNRGGGTVTLDGFKVEIVRVRNTAYVRAGADFYRRFDAQAAAGRLGGKWVKVETTTPNFAPLVSLTDLYAFVTQSLQARGTVTKGATKTVDGRETIELKSAHGGSVFVATSGKPYPLEFTSSVAPAGTVKLRDWNASNVPAPPAHAIALGK